MIICPNCSREMHSVCGNKNCKCRMGIPKDELPMKNLGLFFGKYKTSDKFYGFVWNAMWTLNIGHWIDKANWKFRKKITNYCYHLGITPDKIIFEIQECPYCGYDNSWDYWEDRCCEILDDKMFYA